jgi:hypothetical protein
MRIGVLLALFLLLGIWGVGDGDAADFAVVPSATVRCEYNSNINYAYQAPVSDCIFTVSPAAEFNYTTDTGQLQGRLGLNGLHYVTQSQLDHIDQNYQINGLYQATPRCKLTLNSAFIVDSTLQEEFLVSGLIMTRTPRQSILAAPGITYSLSERLAATLNYNFNRVTYQDQRFQDYTSQQVGLRLDRPLLNEKTVLTANLLGRETRYPGENIFRSLGVYLGANHKFSPEWEINFLGGLNFSFFNFQTQVQDPFQFPLIIQNTQQKVQKKETNPFVNLFATRRWSRLSLNAGYYMDQNASAFGTISNLSRVSVSLSYNFTERLSGSLGGSYSYTNQLSEANSQKNDFLGLTSQITYKLTPEFSLSPGYQFGRRDNISSGQSAQAQVVWVMLTYKQLSLPGLKKPKPLGK